MRIVTLLARHGTETYTDAVEMIDALFARQLPEVARDLLVIDNTLPPHHHETLGPGRTLIGASNAHWEFSAWDSGIAWLAGRIDDYDFVHLATSAFHMLYTDYLARFDAGMLERVRGRATAVGHIDYYDEPVTFGDRALRSWLRSSFVFLPPAELRLLGSLVSIADPRRLFSHDPVVPFRADAPLSPNYRDYIVGWLTGPAGTGQGTEWHSRFALTPSSLARFEAKATAILNEQLLSSRLRTQGCALVDATWLATRHAQLAPDEPLGAFPGWRWQITARDKDAAPRRLIEPHDPTAQRRKD
jgi:hypothetical protein